MVTSEERMKILKMISDGKITAEEGSRLISTLSQRSEKEIKICQTIHIQPDAAGPGYGYVFRKNQGKCQCTHEVGGCRLEYRRPVHPRDGKRPDDGSR